MGGLAPFALSSNMRFAADPAADCMSGCCWSQLRNPSLSYFIPPVLLKLEPEAETSALHHQALHLTAEYSEDMEASAECFQEGKACSQSQTGWSAQAMLCELVLAKSYLINGYMHSCGQAVPTCVSSQAAHQFQDCRGALGNQQTLGHAAFLVCRLPTLNCLQCPCTPHQCVSCHNMQIELYTTCIHLIS